jgi:hypothetical protein
MAGGHTQLVGEFAKLFINQSVKMEMQKYSSHHH